MLNAPLSRFTLWSLCDFCRLPGIHVLITALYEALPAFASIGGVLLLTLFCYAVIGVPLFGSIDLSRAQGLDKHSNFQNVAQV